MGWKLSLWIETKLQIMIDTKTRTNEIRRVQRLNLGVVEAGVDWGSVLKLTRFLLRITGGASGVPAASGGSGDGSGVPAAARASGGSGGASGVPAAAGANAWSDNASAGGAKPSPAAALKKKARVRGLGQRTKDKRQKTKEK